MYRAEDSRLKRSVALKRLAPALRSDPLYRRRFQEEAERASRFADQHVAAIYDVIDEQDEILLVMEYVEGETLRHRLHRPMTLEEFLRIAVQCAEALVAAEHVGIVHCDIKPENIMLGSSGNVKILDFGVAKFLPRSDESSTVDRSGTIGGTPAYMSPEVLLERSADGRSDIFSLGLVLYEALAGHHPFLSDSYVATAQRILHEVATPIRVFNASVPEELEKIVAHALAKDPGDRYAHARDLLGDLRDVQAGVTPSKLLPERRRFGPTRKVSWVWLALPTAILLLGVLGLKSSGLRRWIGIGQTPAAQMHLAILPFRATSEDANSRAFAQGLTETLAVRLTQLTHTYPLQIVSPREVSAEDVKTAEQARKTFGVSMVLEGSLRESNHLVRVSYSLVDTAKLTQLRADTVTVSSEKPFEMEDRVLESIITQLGLELRPQDRNALFAHGTQQPAAYDYYLRGRGYLQEYERPENLDSAITVFRNALKTDPNYALAYAGLGEAYLHRSEHSPGTALVTQAQESCQKAILLADDVPNGHICLGMVYNNTGEYESAVREFERAVRQDPTSDDGFTGLGLAYERLGKVSEAEQTYLRGIELRPQYWGGYAWLGGLYYRQARYQDAARMYTEMIALAPDSFRGYSNLGAMYLFQGRYRDAIPQFQRSISIYATPDAYSNLGAAYFLQGDYADASRTYEKAVEMNSQDVTLYMILGNLAESYYWEPGRASKAIPIYEKAISLAQERLRVNARNVDALSHLALFHAMLRQREVALGYLQRALRISPNEAELLFKAGKIRAQLGDEGDAVRYLQLAVKAGYSLFLIRDDPAFQTLANNVQFQELIRKQD